MTWTASPAASLTTSPASAPLRGYAETAASHLEEALNGAVLAEAAVEDGEDEVTGEWLDAAARVLDDEAAAGRGEDAPSLGYGQGSIRGAGDRGRRGVLQEPLALLRHAD